MSGVDDNPPTARQRRRWFSWIWVVPTIAVGIVVWLTVMALVDRGPQITISFSDAEGLQADDTKIRHKDVDLGTVESIYLNREMSRVFVRARMRRSVAPHLNAGARFWIVRPRVGAGGISGLSTLVSGSYIEMYPGAEAKSEGNHPQRSFVGLDDPPVLTPDTPGRSFTLRTDDLGSLVGGSPVSFRGVPVGEIEGYQLDPDGKQLNVYAFVRAPYERFVTAQTRFWNSGGIDLAVGVQGLRFRASSWQQLISGGVSFDTPDESIDSGESRAGEVFRLYGNQYVAERDPRVQTLVYGAVFHGGAGDIGPGTDVQLQGAAVGQVTKSYLQFDDATQSLITRVTLEIDPSKVQIVRKPGDAASDNDQAAALGARIEKLIGRGLRAHLVSANFLTGSKVVSLDMIPEAGPGHISREQGIAELPTTATTDITAILASVQSVLHHVDSATAGPELGHSIKELDATLTHLDRVSAEIEPQVQPLMASLRQAADAAQRTLQAANNVLGTSAASGADLPRLIRELTDSARSLRDLADYLERHPESLLRGRRPDRPTDKP
ncbi:MAG: MlaD family protein [Steroidobacteraceae bacterium]